MTVEPESPILDELRRAAMSWVAKHYDPGRGEQESWSAALDDLFWLNADHSGFVGGPPQLLLDAAAEVMSLCVLGEHRDVLEGLGPDSRGAVTMARAAYRMTFDDPRSLPSDRAAADRYAGDLSEPRVQVAFAHLLANWLGAARDGLSETAAAFYDLEDETRRDDLGGG